MKKIFLFCATIILFLLITTKSIGFASQKNNLPQTSWHHTENLQISPETFDTMEKGHGYMYVEAKLDF
ncbi:hypothetical protein KKA15_02955 [Patescibacteria group bacterium]|nr:hypothetical protein [Patescibacteria group bacterium]